MEKTKLEVEDVLDMALERLNALAYLAGKMSSNVISVRKWIADSEGVQDKRAFAESCTAGMSARCFLLEDQVSQLTQELRKAKEANAQLAGTVGR